MKSLKFLSLISFFVVSSFCLAKPPFLKVFMNTYGIKEDSAIGKARCLNCHLPPGPPNRNPYGKAVQAALERAQARMVTAEILKSVELKNGGGTVNFITKIKKDIPPGTMTGAGKPAAKPAKAKAKAKRPSKKRAMLFGGASAWLLMCMGGAGFVVGRRRA